MRVFGVVTLTLAGVLLLAGCDQLIPANQKMMKDAIRAGDQAIRSEEKTWAMLLRMEELAQRLEKAAKDAEASAVRAEAAALKLSQDAAQAARQSGAKADDALARANEAAERAAAAAQQAETAARRIEQQESESYQRMLEFMRELGDKP